MTSVFVIGAGGVGKTTLIQNYVSESRREAKLIKEVARTIMRENRIAPHDLDDDPTFWRLQVDIIERQLHLEKELAGEHYISDRSTIDALVYAAMRFPDRFPTLIEAGHANDKIVDNLFEPLLGLSLQTKGKISDMICRYRRSLVVLLYPFGDFVEPDGVRIVMESVDLAKYTELCRDVLRLLGIPFLELCERETPVRVNVLEKALAEFTVPSPLWNLQRHANLSSKKGKDRQAAARQFQEVNLAFYRTPSRRETEQDALVPCISLTTTKVNQSFTTAEPGRSNRFALLNDTDRLFLLEFQRDISPSDVQAILNAGVRIQGERYSFLGCSSGGLKRRKCYVVRGNASEADDLRQLNGDFASIDAVSKQIARFSLLLTSVVATPVQPLNIINEEDVDTTALGGGNFTDGCGSISSDLAAALFRATKKVLTRKSEQLVVSPSVFQIRYQGYKGVVVVQSNLKASTMVLRPSMKKFETQRFPDIAVCDYSRAYSYGHLNRQFIMLLSGLGVPDEVFETLQGDYFYQVRNMLHDPQAALMILEWLNRAQEIVCGDEEVRYATTSSEPEDSRPPYWHLRSLQRRLIADASRLRILIPESRTLFGVSEQPRFCPNTGERLQGRLQPGECLVRITVSGNLKKTLRGQPVVVSKTPCYLLGDVRVLRAVSSLDRHDLQDLERDLVDCIVFPIEGSRPHSNEIAGSDLDGDKYFVCWDKRLLPPGTRAPYEYPAYEAGAKRATSRRQNGASEFSVEMVEYFSNQSTVTNNTGRVDALFRAWADKLGVNCAQCVRLGQLFSRVVDSAKSGENIEIPKALLIPKEHRLPPCAQSRFIWQRMEFAAENFVRDQQLGQWRGEISFDTDENESEILFLVDLLARNHLGMSEFTKFRLVLDYLDGDIHLFFNSEFLPYVNFGKFSSAERGYAVGEFGVPPYLLFNAFRCYSHLIGARSDFLAKFGFDAKLPWSLYWRSTSTTSAAMFSDVLVHALRSNTDAMLLAQAPDGVVLILHFSRSDMSRSMLEALFADNSQHGCKEMYLANSIDVHAYFISGAYDYHFLYSLENPSYKLDLSQDGLQLYREDHRNTFVHLKVFANHINVAKAPDDQERGLLAVQLSVDLTRFNRNILTGRRRHPVVRKTYVGEMEIFAYNRKSNYSKMASRGITYLDMIINEDNECYHRFDVHGGELLKDEDNVDDLLPTGVGFCECIPEATIMADAPETSLKLGMSFLQSSCQQFGLCPRIPKQVCEKAVALAEIMMTNLLPVVEPPTRLLLLARIAACLADLGLRVSLPRFRVDGGDFAVVSSFLEALRNWDAWLVLPTPQIREKVLGSLKSEINVSVLDCKLEFVYRNACEQATALLAELRDSSYDSRASCSVSRVGNLRLDPAQPFWTEAQDESGGEKRSSDLPVVTFFRVQAVPQRVNKFTVGEYVCISRQNCPAEEESNAKPSNLPSKLNDDDFPPLPSANRSVAATTHGCAWIVSGDFTPKSSTYCLGRVVNLCEAPFSLSIKVVAPTYGNAAAPDLLLACLSSNPSIYWEVSVVPANVITHTRNIDALVSILDSTKSSIAPELLPYLMSPMDGHKESSIRIGGQPLPQVDTLNECQNVAVQCMLKERVSLVHGPGGTGKTTTAVQMMFLILKHSENRILVCAETNLAVDNLALCFLQQTRRSYGIVRVGRLREDRKEGALEIISLERKVRDKVKSKARHQFHLSRYKKVIAEILAESRVVFATCAGAGDPVLSKQRFESVIIDEASMSTEPGALCALVHGCCHLVLIGDHKQIGPHANEGACVSLFERLSNTKGACVQAGMTFLNEQHRMHPELISFPSRVFYDAKLLTAAGIEEARKTPYVFFGGRKPVRFIDIHNGCEARVNSGSWYNDAEIERVLDIVKVLLNTDELVASQVTVLTFYRAQQVKLRERFLSWKKPTPEVCSVDGYQGKENEVIVASTVRTGSSLGFCDDERRINVLLTRPKRGLIIVGHRDSLQTSVIWSQWLNEFG